jgi:hypothetical protein
VAFGKQRERNGQMTNVEIGSFLEGVEIGSRWRHKRLLGCPSPTILSAEN